MKHSTPSWPRVIAQATRLLDAAAHQNEQAAQAALKQVLHLMHMNGVSRSNLLTVPEIAIKLKMKEKTVYEHAPHWPFMKKLPGSRVYRALEESIDNHFRERGK